MIAEAILNQIRQAGQPRVVKETITTKGDEPLNLPGLGLLLYMMMTGQKTPTQPLVELPGMYQSPQLMGMESLAPFGTQGMNPSEILSFLTGGMPSMGLI